jgi:hypothetical protein
VTKNDEPQAATTEAAAPVETAAPETPAAQIDEGKPVEPEPVIKSKDGKHEIPYSVLQAERQRARTLEAQIAELSTKLASVQTEVAGGKQDTTPAIDEIIDPAALEQLREEAPVLAKTIDALIGTIGKLQADVTDSKRVAASVEADRQATQKTAVDEAIDAVPKLSHVKQNDVEAFNKIADIDAFLRSNPAYQGMNLVDRFNKAVSMFEAAEGPIELPQRARQPSQAEVKAKADAVVEKAKNDARPQTLTDLPGGAPPPKNDLETVENMTATSLTSKFMNMTPQQVEAFLARL